MNDRDVKAFLQKIGISRTNGGNGEPGDKIIQKLMNHTLQCLGTLRQLVVEEENVRISKECCDLDESYVSDSKSARLTRELYGSAVVSMVESIIAAKEFEDNDPLKNLAETFPWAASMEEASWCILHWAVLGDTLIIADDSDRKKQIDDIKQIIKIYPDSLEELNKLGQNCMVYGIQMNCMPLVKAMMYPHSRDGVGKYPIHYSCYYTQLTDLFDYVLERTLLLDEDAEKEASLQLPAEGSSSHDFDYNIELILSPQQQLKKQQEAVLKEQQRVSLMTTPEAGALYKHVADEYGNLPLHCAASGLCCLDIVRELVFTYPDATKVLNNDGKLPLHLCMQNKNLEIVKLIFAAYPLGVSRCDKNGWLPIHHAAYHAQSLEVMEFIYTAYPAAIAIPHQPSGRVPLHYAAANCKSPELLQYILDLYPDGASTFDTHRRLPLHNLIARCKTMDHNRIACLRVLIVAYPHAVCMSGSDGLTPFDLARRDGHGDLVLLLLLHGDPSMDNELYESLSARYKGDEDEQHDSTMKRMDQLRDKEKAVAEQVALKQAKKDALAASRSRAASGSDEDNNSNNKDD